MTPNHYAKSKEEGDNLQVAELELLLHWENYARTERHHEDPTETPTSLHRDMARVGRLNPLKEGEEQQGGRPSSSSEEAPGGCTTVWAATMGPRANSSLA